PWPLSAQPDEVARSAGVHVPRRKTRKLVRAQRVAGVPDFVSYGGQQWVVHRLTGGLALLVEVQDLDQVCGFPGELLVSEGVNVELVAGDILGLGAVGGLEVDDRNLAGVEAANKVDAAVDGDARRNVDLYLLFGELRVGDLLTVGVEVALDRLYAGVPQLLSQRWVRE